MEPQKEIVDGYGRLLGRADLWIRGTRRLPEYDGATHRERERHQADLAREKALAREHWERYGYTAKEILRTPERVVRDAAEASGLTHDTGSLAVWRALVSESSLSNEGCRRLWRRLARFRRTPP